MARGRQTELLALAIRSLQQAGFTVTPPGGPVPYGRNVRRLGRGAALETALIQTRSSQPDSSRYMVGIIRADLARVDCVVLWFEDEQHYLHMPSEFLRRLHDSAQEREIARYTGVDDRQWRIDIHLDERTVSPQGSDGERHWVTEYIVRVGQLPGD